MFNRIKKVFGFQTADEKFVTESKAFCMMPWVHFHITQYGTVTPCCQAPWQEEEAYGNINRQSIDEIWNSKPIKAFRKKMLSDQPDKRCERCYKKELAGSYSLRKATNKDYLHHLERVNKTTFTGYSDSPPIYFDIRFSNFCNFRCRICGPWSSSSWFQDARALGTNEKDLRLTKAIQNEEEFFEEFKKYLPEVEELYFAGGEPLLMEQHYRVLDLLLEAGLTKTYLRYNTNFSTFEFRGKSIFDYWKKFPNIFLCASLDDNYKRGEFQRKGQDWNDVVQKRRQLLVECPHIDFMLAPTVSIMNVFHLPEFHKEWTEMGLIDVSEIFPSLLDVPEHYNIKALPKAMKEKVGQLYQAHHKWMMKQPSKDEAVKKLIAEEFLHCIDFMWSEDLGQYLSQFANSSKALDDLRGESSKAIAPELSSILENRET